MKKIETLIQPAYWEQVYAALAELGVPGTVRQVKSFGRTPPRREVYRGSAYLLETNSELELSLIVPDELLDTALDAIARAAGDPEAIVSSIQTLGGSVANRPRAVATAVDSEPVIHMGVVATAGV
ncbi:MAG TPA: P-II family nitrogen regulator [Polyangiaceae bacterium]|nr:P-II family nitrogen regulator [Polyangiaceae bacterium]